MSIGPVRAEFFPGKPTTQQLTIFLSGGRPGHIEIDLFDLVLGANGGWERLPFGSTAGSLEGTLSFPTSPIPYIPTDGEQQIPVSLTLDPSSLNRILFGTLVATLVADDPGEPGTATIQPSVGIQIVAAPEASALPLTNIRLALDSLSVAQRDAWTPIDALLPDIPGVVGRGPAVLTASGKNVGEIFLDSVTVFEVRRISPLSLLSGSDVRSGPILRISMAPRYTLPGQRYRDETTTLIPLDSGEEVDSLPFIGFVRVTARATGSLGSIVAAGNEISKTVLVFPWSETSFVLLIWVFSRGRRRRGHAAPPRAGFRQRLREVRGRGRSQGSGYDPDQPTLF